MSYRSILTYTDTSDASAGRLEAAIKLAQQFDAHLSVMAVGFDYTVPAYAFGTPGTATILDFIAEARDEATMINERARQAIEQAGLRGDAEPVVCTRATLAHEIARRAEFADLVVLSPPYGDEELASATDVFEGALLESDRPVLVCRGAAPPADAASALIGWNGTREALRAIRGALPYLARAETVGILMITRQQAEPDPGQALATMLSRHGIASELTVEPPSAEPAGEALLRHVREAGAGMLVIGGYGHSRLREYVIGGVTRDVVTTATVPVLLAH